MPSFKLKDGFGLSANVTAGSGALLKYFQNLPDITVSTIDLSKPPVTSAQGGLTFSQPIDIGKSGVELKVGATASGTLSIFVPDKDGAPLFNPDTFGDNIPVGKNLRYVSLALSAELNGGASASPGDLKFGFNGRSKVVLAFYERFTADAKALAAVKDTIANFSIPADLDDIDAMPENSIATVEGSGELKFSGSANLLSVTNPLATANVPAAGAIGVTGGAALDVAADFKLSSDYQVRVQRLAGKKFRMGFYRKRGSQFTFSVDAKVSLTAKLGDNDLFVKLMQKISSDPKGDLKRLEAAGLSEDQSKDIQAAIKSAVNRSLEIGASVELSNTAESAAMFLYEVDLNAVQLDGRTLLHSALEGDLSGLVKTDIKPPAGIRVLKTLISTKKTFQHSLKVNLLGIYNVLQLSTLLKETKAAWDAATGELVLTDRIAADKIQVITSNLQVKDSDKLRQILAEHFLITAAYRAADKVVAAAELKGLQSFFNLEKNPSKIRMRDYLLIPATLDLQTPTALPAGIKDFGDTTVYAEAGYDNKAFRSLFFDENGKLYGREIYTNAGRLAIKCLVQAGDDDAFRLLLATNDALFKALAKIGSVSSGIFAETCTNAGVPRDNVAVVGTDFVNVAWFADAMQTAGKRLQEIDKFLQKNPNTDPENHDFKQLKKQLADSLGKAADSATVDFGGPWGFETMALLKKSSSKKWILINRYITSTLPAAGRTPE